MRIGILLCGAVVAGIGRGVKQASQSCQKQHRLVGCTTKSLTINVMCWPQTWQRASQDLGVRYVLEGSVRKAAERVRITAQLIDATTGTHLCGPSGMTGCWKMFSQCRMRSPGTL